MHCLAPYKAMPMTTPNASGGASPATNPRSRVPPSLDPNALALSGGGRGRGMAAPVVVGAKSIPASAAVPLRSQSQPARQSPTSQQQHHGARRAADATPASTGHNPHPASARPSTGDSTSPATAARTGNSQRTLSGTSSDTLRSPLLLSGPQQQQQQQSQSRRRARRAKARANTTGLRIQVPDASAAAAAIHHHQGTESNAAAGAADAVPSRVPASNPSTSSSSRGHTPRATITGTERATALIATTAIATPPEEALDGSQRFGNSSNTNSIAVDGPGSHHTTTAAAATTTAARLPTSTAAITASSSHGDYSPSSQATNVGHTPLISMRFPSPTHPHSHGATTSATVSPTATTTTTGATAAAVTGLLSPSQPAAAAAAAAAGVAEVPRREGDRARDGDNETDETAFMTLNLDEDPDDCASGNASSNPADADRANSNSRSSQTGGKGSGGGVVLLRPDVVPEDLVCAICLNIACDPTVTECGHIFCHRCITAAARAKPECPLDRQPIADERNGGLRSDVRARRQIKRLPCACPAALTVEQRERILGVRISVPSKAAMAMKKRRLQRERAAAAAAAGEGEVPAPPSAEAAPPATIDAGEQMSPTLAPGKSLSRTQPPPTGTDGFDDANSTTPRSNSDDMGSVQTAGSSAAVTPMRSVAGAGAAAAAAAAGCAAGAASSCPVSPSYGSAKEPQHQSTTSTHLSSASVCAILDPCHWTGSVSDAAEHLKSCPHHAIPCPYASQGCKAIVPRGLMDLHLAESRDQHLLLVERALESSQCQCAVLQEEVEVMRQRCSRFLSQMFSHATNHHTSPLSPSGSHSQLPLSSSNPNPGANSTAQLRPQQQTPTMPVFTASPFAPQPHPNASHGGGGVGQHLQPSPQRALPFSVTTTHNTHPHPSAATTQVPLPSSHSPLFAYRSISLTDTPAFNPAAAAAALSASAPNLFAASPLGNVSYSNHQSGATTSTISSHHHRLVSPASVLTSTAPTFHQNTGGSGSRHPPPGEEAAGESSSVLVRTFSGSLIPLDELTPLQAHPTTTATATGSATVTTTPASVPTAMTTNSVGSGIVHNGGTFFIWVLPNFLGMCRKTSYSRSFTAFGLRWCMGIDYHGRQSSTTSSNNNTTTTTSSADAAAVPSASTPAATTPSPTASSANQANPTPVTNSTGNSSGNARDSSSSPAAYSGLYLFAQGHSQRVPFRLFLFNKDPAKDVVHTVEDWAESYRGKGWGPVRFIDRRTVAERGFICGPKGCLRVGVEILGAPY